jgi:hypothetical protein
MPNQNSPADLKRRLLDLKSKLLRDHVLVDLVKECLVELRRQSLREKPLYQAHLRRLADPAGFSIDEVEVAYPLDRSARVINPTFVLPGDAAKPVLCMVCIGRDFAQAVELGTQSKRDYCRRHGYGLVVLETAPESFDRPVSWLRLSLIFRLLKMGHPSVFYLDADTLITNPGIPLETYFERLEKTGRHLLISEDPLSLNTGALFFRRTWQSLLLLDLIYETDIDVEHHYWEQNALVELARQQAQVLALLEIETRLTEQELETYAWQPGDFICHFAGVRSGPKLAAAMRRIRGVLDGKTLPA